MLEEKITSIISDNLAKLGLDVVQVRIVQGLYKTVEILIERQDQAPTTIDDCSAASRNIGPLLEVENIMKGKYALEVASAGVERPLVSKQDFQKYKGRLVKIRLKTAIDNRMSYKGILGEINNDHVCIIQDNKDCLIELHNIKSAKLVMTDEMFKQSLNKK